MNAFTSRNFILRTLCLSSVLVLVLVGCGSDSPPVKPKAVDKPVASSPPEPSTLPPPKLPDEPALPKNPVTAPTATAPATKEATKPDAAATPAPAGKKMLDEFDPEVVGGRSIGKWMEMLRSDKKDDIIEAAEVMKQIPGKAKNAIPRLQELTKNADKEIAQEATDVLKALNAK